MRPLVLVIDDDIDLREVLETILDDLGYDMIACGDGRAALDCLQRIQCPQLILVDLMMPVMNGREFLRRQCKLPSIRDIPTLVMSASTTLKEEFGEGKYLQKPFNLPLLKHTLEKVLDGQAAR